MPSITINAGAPITLPSNTAEIVIWATTPGNLIISNLGPDIITIQPTSTVPGDTNTPLPPGTTRTLQPVTTTWRAGHGRCYTISTPTTTTINYGITDVPADTGHAK